MYLITYEMKKISTHTHVHVLFTLFLNVHFCYGYNLSIEFICLLFDIHVPLFIISYCNHCICTCILSCVVCTLWNDGNFSFCLICLLNSSGIIVIMQFEQHECIIYSIVSMHCTCNCTVGPF